MHWTLRDCAIVFPQRTMALCVFVLSAFDEGRSIGEKKKLYWTPQELNSRHNFKHRKKEKMWFLYLLCTESHAANERTNEEQQRKNWISYYRCSRLAAQQTIKIDRPIEWVECLGHRYVCEAWLCFAARLRRLDTQASNGVIGVALSHFTFDSPKKWQQTKLCMTESQYTRRLSRPGGGNTGANRQLQAESFEEGKSKNSIMISRRNTFVSRYPAPNSERLAGWSERQMPYENKSLKAIYHTFQEWRRV